MRDLTERINDAEAGLTEVERVDALMSAHYERPLLGRAVNRIAGLIGSTTYPSKAELDYWRQSQRDPWGNLFDQSRIFHGTRDTWGDALLISHTSSVVEGGVMTPDLLNFAEAQSLGLPSPTEENPLKIQLNYRHNDEYSSGPFRAEQFTLTYFVGDKSETIGLTPQSFAGLEDTEKALLLCLPGYVDEQSTV